MSDDEQVKFPGLFASVNSRLKFECRGDAVAATLKKKLPRSSGAIDRMRSRECEPRPG